MKGHVVTVESDNKYLVIIMVGLFFVFFLFTLITLFCAESTIRYSKWQLTSSRHVQLDAKIISCQIAEAETRSHTTPQGSTVFVSNYYPVLTVQFKLNDSTITSEVPLNAVGYANLDSAINAIIAVAPGMKIRYTQTSRSGLEPYEAKLLSNLRIHTDPNVSHMISLTVDSKNPNINNYYFKQLTISEVLLLLAFFLMGTTGLIVIFVFLKELPLSLRLQSLLITIILIITFYFGIPYLFKKQSVIMMASPNNTPVLDITIDDAFDGSQLTPFLEKD